MLLSASAGVAIAAGREGGLFLFRLKKLEEDGQLPFSLQFNRQSSLRFRPRLKLKQKRQP